MSDGREDDGHERPWDPAGTRPRHRPEDVLPARPAGTGGPGGGLRSRGPAPGAPPSSSPPPRDPVLAVATAHDASADGSRFAARFQFLTGVLLAVAVAALVALGAVLAHDDAADGAGDRPWSAFVPDEAEGAPSAPAQIADHVAARYRQDGRQLVDVTPGLLQLQGEPLPVVRRDLEGDLDVAEGATLQYTLRGSGEGFAIDGRPTETRGLLMQRLALELALYTFRYVDAADQVLVELPPVEGVRYTRAVHLKRDEVEELTKRPLDQTLSTTVPAPDQLGGAQDTPTVQAVVGPHFYAARVDQEAPALVLEPADPPPGTTVPRGTLTTPSGATGATGDTGSSG